MSRSRVVFVVFAALLVAVAGRAQESDHGLYLVLVDADGKPIREADITVTDYSGHGPVRGNYPVWIKEDGRVWHMTNGREPLASGAFQISITLPGEKQPGAQRFVYAKPGEKTQLFIQVMGPVDAGSLLTSAQAAARSGDKEAYERAQAGLNTALDGQTRVAAGAAEAVEGVQADVLNDPSLRGTGRLRRDLENAPTPHVRAEIARRYHDEQKAKLDKLDKTIGASQDAKDALHRVGNLRLLFSAQSEAEQAVKETQDAIRRLPPLRTKSAYEPGSMNPAGPGQFYATVGSGIQYANLPNWGYVNFADVEQQVIFRRNVVDDDNDDDVGFGVGGGFGYVFDNAFLFEKNWLDIQVGYRNIDSSYSTSAIETNADQEFWGPQAVGFSVFGPNGGLRDVHFETEWQNLDLKLSLAAEMPPCGCNVTLTPILGVVYRRTEWNAEMNLDASTLKVTRRDDLTSDAGGYLLGLYASKPVGPITLYSGFHTSGLYQDADGHSRLVASGGADFFERKNLSEDGFVVEVGGVLGFRYDWRDWLSIGLEGGVDWTNGALSIDYPQDSNSPAEIDFENALGASVGLKLTVPF